MINTEILKGKWKVLKGNMLKEWGKLTGDELEQTKGDMLALAGLLQQKYGLSKEEAHEKLKALNERSSVDFIDTDADAGETH